MSSIHIIILYLVLLVHMLESPFHPWQQWTKCYNDITMNSNSKCLKIFIINATKEQAQPSVKYKLFKYSLMSRLLLDNFPKNLLAGAWADWTGLFRQYGCSFLILIWNFNKLFPCPWKRENVNWKTDEPNSCDIEYTKM